MDPSPSLIDRQPLVEPAVLAFAAAARALQLGDRRSAIRLVVAIDDDPLRNHFIEAGLEWQRRHDESATPYPDAVEPALRDPQRLPTGRRAARLFERDLWHCRWCGTPVLALDAVKKMHKAVGHAYPHGGTNDTRHGLTLAAGASVDHVIPHSVGGGNDERNLVTACWPCQFARGNDSLVRLHLQNPLDREPASVLAGWDGCDWFR